MTLAAASSGADYISVRHPHLFHMTDASGLESIKRLGLLSTSALLDSYGLSGPEREAIESEWRKDSIPLSHPTYGTAVIRDQKPMRPAALERCLTDGMAPTDWYRLLNHKVFFWPGEKQVMHLLGARAYRGTSHIVLRVDTASLLGDPTLTVWATPLNTGSAIRRPVPRARTSFVPVAEAAVMRRIAEIAVDYAVPDVRRHLVAIELRHGSDKPREIPLW